MLVSHPLDKCISTTCNDRTCERADPVNPVVAVKAYDDGRAKTTRGVETAASEVDAAHLGDEEGETNVHWLSISTLQHQDGEHELGSDETLQEEPSRDGD